MQLGETVLEKLMSSNKCHENKVNCLGDTIYGIDLKDDNIVMQKVDER